jgi:alkylation response protein AidB-like acyl-CoA dehydrogenase
MNLDLDETRTLLRDTVRGYLEQEVTFERVRSLEREQGWDEALWQALCRQGWLGLPFGEEHGGGGGSLVDAGLLVEEFARRAVIVPLLEVLVAGRALERHAAGGRAGDLVEALLAGDALPVAAIAEAGDGFEAIALEVDGRGRLRGEKAFVDYGQIATHHLVAARAEGEVALLLVESAGPQVSCRSSSSIGRTPLCAVRYEDAPAERVAGGEAFSMLVREGRALAAVQCVGSMAQALDMTVRYACVREQFGKPIGSFQAVRHHCANMAIRLASARLLAFEALSALDAGRGSDAQVALAKASASRAVPEVTMLAHQIHGGNGMIEENDLYFFTLRGKESSLAWGSAEECLAVVAQEVDSPKDWL